MTGTMQAELAVARLHEEVDATSDAWEDLAIAIGRWLEMGIKDDDPGIRELHDVALAADARLRVELRLALELVEGDGEEP